MKVRDLRAILNALPEGHDDLDVYVGGIYPSSRRLAPLPGGPHFAPAAAFVTNVAIWPVGAFEIRDADPPAPAIVNAFTLWPTVEAGPTVAPARPLPHDERGWQPK